MKEILIQLGFVMYSSCSCGGTYAEKYKLNNQKGLFICEIKPNRNIWTLKNNGVFQVKGTKENLTEKLNEII